jgi:hypothetical protein
MAGTLVDKKKQNRGTDGRKGGYAKGDKHSDPSGGISAEVGSEKKPIKFEGGEVVITAPAVEDPTKREFEGEMLTNRQILSKINVSGGGVSFADGGEIPRKIRFDKNKTYQVGGKTMTAGEVVEYCGCGCVHEKESRKSEAGGQNNKMTFEEFNAKYPDIYGYKNKGKQEWQLPIVHNGGYKTFYSTEKTAYAAGRDIYKQYLADTDFFAKGGNTHSPFTIHHSQAKEELLAMGGTLEGRARDYKLLDPYTEFGCGGRFKEGGQIEISERYQIKGPSGYYKRNLKDHQPIFTANADEAFFYTYDEAEDMLGFLRKRGFNQLEIVPFYEPEMAAKGMDFSAFERQQKLYGDVNIPALAKGGTIKDKVLAAADELKAMKTHTELRQWAISHGMDNRSAFPKFKDALHIIGMDYEAIRSGIRQAAEEELKSKVKYQVTLYVDAKASHDRFAITDEDGNVLWYGKFFDNDSDYNGEQSSGELAAAKKAVWLASKIKEATGSDAIKLNLYVDAQWLTYQDHPGQKGFVLTQLARKYNIDLNIEWIPGANNPADSWTTRSGYKKWSDNNLRSLVKTLDDEDVKEEEMEESRLSVSEIKKKPQVKAVKVNGFFTEYDKSYGRRVSIEEHLSEQEVHRMMFFPKKLTIERTDEYIIVPEWIFDKKIEELKEDVSTSQISTRSISVLVDYERIWVDKPEAITNEETPQSGAPTQLESKSQLESENSEQQDSENNKTGNILTEKYSNAYELNKAIEKLLDSHSDDHEWTAAEKEFIKRYSGYGGLEKFGAEGKGLLYEYYTPSLIAEKMWALAYKYGYKSGSVLEPAAGIGEFVKYAPCQACVTAYEINPYSAKILKILYPEAKVFQNYFEELFIVNRNTIKGKISGLKKYDLVIGNPPYGEFAGKFAGMGEKQYTRAANYIDYFIFRGLDLLNPGGLLVYIVGAEVASGGKPFLQQQANACKNEIMEKSELLDAYRLPNGVFERTDVLTDIIVLKKK